MSNQSFYTRQMLTTYGRQLVSARRLVRYEQLIGRQSPAEDAVAFRRKLMIERVSREIVENLIFSGSENPIVLEVRKALEQEFGVPLEFHYPPADLEYRVYRVEKDGRRIELADAEKKNLMDRLWEVTVRTVDATTL